MLNTASSVEDGVPIEEEILKDSVGGVRLVDVRDESVSPVGWGCGSFVAAAFVVKGEDVQAVTIAMGCGTWRRRARVGSVSGWILGALGALGFAGLRFSFAGWGEKWKMGSGGLLLLCRVEVVVWRL